MQIRDNYEEIILKEIREFPKSKLPKLIKLMHFLRLELIGKSEKELQKPKQFTIESVMGSFKGMLSTSQEFSARKKEEKGLEL